METNNIPNNKLEEEKSSKDYYDENPESYKKKLKYQAKYNKKPREKKRIAQLNKYNREKGTYGNGDGKDASHKGGKIVGFEDESTNRARNGKGSTHRKKKNEIKENNMSAYKEFFKKKMIEFGVDSIKKMSDEQKKKFFNAVDKSWKSKNENKAFSMSEAKLDPKNQQLKKQYIDDYLDSVLDYDGLNDYDVDAIEAHAKQFGYENVLKQIDQQYEKQAERYAKNSAQPGDKLAIKAATKGQGRITKQGKMHKSDAEQLKATIKRNLGLK